MIRYSTSPYNTTSSTTDLARPQQALGPRSLLLPLLTAVGVVGLVLIGTWAHQLNLAAVTQPPEQAVVRQLVSTLTANDLPGFTKVIDPDRLNYFINPYGALDPHSQVSNSRVSLFKLYTEALSGCKGVEIDFPRPVEYSGTQFSIRAKFRTACVEPIAIIGARQRLSNFTVVGNPYNGNLLITDFQVLE